MTKGLFRNLFRQPSYKEFCDNLSRVVLFQGLTRKEIRSMLPIFHLRRYKEKEFIFRKKQPSYGVFIIYKGKVKIFDKEKTLAVLRDCEFFGEIALVSDIPRNASAQALKSSVLIYTSKYELVNFFIKKPKVGVKLLMNISKVLGHRLGYVNKQLVKALKK